MKTFKPIATLVLISISSVVLGQIKQTVESFSKVIVSPHIETTFVHGDEESVTILDNTLSDDKVNVEVIGGTLRVYLDNAKEVTKQNKVVKNGYKMNIPIYTGKVLTILVTYKYIDHLSLRGDQRTVCESAINVEKFKLKIYGESQVTFNEVNFKELNADIYGESQLTMKNGVIDYQDITAYGEGNINLVEVENKIAKLKAYGEAEFRINTSERIKFTTYGEAELYYKGGAEVNKGLSFGESTITQID